MNDPRPIGKILSLQLCPGYRKPMRHVSEAQVIEDLGLKGDMHAIMESARQVLLLESETLEALGLKPGEVKENVTTVEIALMHLQHKQRLALGDSVLLEVTRPCSPCSRMEEIRPGLLGEIAGRRGMLFRVIRGGVIRSGDPVRLAV